MVHLQIKKTIQRSRWDYLKGVAGGICREHANAKLWTPSITAHGISFKRLKSRVDMVESNIFGIRIVLDGTCEVEAAICTPSSSNMVVAVGIYTRRHDMEMTWHVSIHLWISCRSHSFKRGQAAPRHHDTKIEWGAGQAPASPLNLFIRSCHYKTCAAACNMLKMWQTQRHIEFKLDHVVEHFGAV